MEQVERLQQRESHFAFGENWASYSRLITEEQIEAAVVSLRRLVGDLAGKRFLDIGCGSGLHSVAALRLGAREVLAVDIDADSVATTRHILEIYAAGSRWQVAEASIFDLDGDALGRFDLVYSWGVLHHTGNLLRALRTAARLVAPGGQFAFALYRRTPMCRFWKAEKRWYAQAHPNLQRAARALYIALYRWKHRRQLTRYLAGYKSKRGMDFQHDVHDWLGGWPYESTTPEEVDVLMRELGLARVRVFPLPAGQHRGLFGTGCDEYVYARE